ncbi:hypothetical protein SUGI_0360100 [Cryptomeria japonica]|nr:hypothetical protein SUGI_0360100 [Cryptomeria japonica]
MSNLLGVTVILNNIQPVPLSICVNIDQKFTAWMAVGSCWQTYVAYINIGCYYVIEIKWFESYEKAFQCSIVGPVSIQQIGHQ